MNFARLYIACEYDELRIAVGFAWVECRVDSQHGARPHSLELSLESHATCDALLLSVN